MNVYVWQRIEKATDNYHEEGGLVVFAETLERAVELANEAGAKPDAAELPDEVRACSGGESVYVMRNAGCC